MARFLAASLAVLAAAALVTSCKGVRTEAMRLTPPLPAVALADSVRVRTAGRIVRVPLEEYVLGTALSEAYPAGESAEVATRIFEVQAIIARTFAVSHLERHRSEGFDLCDETHCQLYQPDRIDRSVFTAVASEGVRRTTGQILTYGGRPLQAFFHADCGGHTAASNVIWGGTVAYLAAERDDVPDETHRTWVLDVTSSQLIGALNASTDTRVGPTVSALRVADRDESGRAATVEITGPRASVRLRGERFRAVLNQSFGPKALLSSRFDVESTADGYRFSGSGFGHGVGLCQVGAAARARRGDSREAILAAYFRGAELATSRTPVPPVNDTPRPAEPRPSPAARPSPFPSANLSPTATIAR